MDRRVRAAGGPAALRAESPSEAGTIVWPGDGLDMAPEPLYAEARRHLVSRPAVSA